MANARSGTYGAWVALLTAGVMIAQQVGAKATRDALFLGTFRAEDLPAIVLASAAASLAAVFGASALFVRFGPAGVVPPAFAASGTLYLVEFGLQPLYAPVAAVLVYLHSAVFGALLISGFWSIVNEVFDPHTAKSEIGRIGGGATAGGVLGGALAMGVGSSFEARVMLLALAGLNLMAAAGTYRLGAPIRGLTTSARIGASPAAGVAILRRQPYLQALGAMVGLTAMAATLLDYAFKARAADAYAAGGLLSFFALFHTATALLSLVVQTSLARPLITRLGVGGSVALLPTAVLLTSMVGVAISNLWTAVVARGTELVLANSTFRSGYELLYTPVPPAEKRPTKALIDVVGNRLGDAAGSGLVLLVLALALEHPLAVVLGLAGGLSLLALIVAQQLNGGYVGELKRSLRTGTRETSDAAVMDAATLQTLSTLGLDREALFEQLAARQAATARDQPAVRPRSQARLDAVDAPDDDPLHEAVETLRRGTGEQVRTLLSAGEELDPRLVPHAVALLARRDVYPAAIAALRKVADRSAPELAEAIADPDQPFAIRRRLPRVLEVTHHPAALDGLLRGLDDERFEVRYRCAIALARILHRDESVPRPDPERVLDAVERELSEAGRRVWDSRRLLDDDADEDSPLLQKALRDRVNRSVEHVFTLLSLTYDPEPLRLSLLALAEEEGALRGTALEYLDTVLPERTRTSLFPMLDERVELRRRPERRRSRDEIVQELVSSMRSIDGGALARAIRERAIAAQDSSPPDDAES